jgi:hypothetical protein
MYLKYLGPEPMTDFVDSSQEDATSDPKSTDGEQVEENEETGKEPVQAYEHWLDVPRPFLEPQASDSTTPRSIPNGGMMARSFIKTLIPDSNLMKLMGLDELAKAMDAQTAPAVAIQEVLTTSESSVHQEHSPVGGQHYYSIIPNVASVRVKKRARIQPVLLQQEG